MTSVTTSDLDQYASVSQIGSSNAAICKYTGKGYAQWTDGIKVYSTSNDTIRFFGKGAQVVTLTVKGTDGSVATKEFTNVNVASMDYYVDPTYGYLCGSGTRTWVWNTDLKSYFGKGGYLEIDPTTSSNVWWGLTSTEVDDKASTVSGASSKGDGTGASMAFTLSGTKMVKSDGTSGTFKLDMSNIKKAGWDLGNITFNGVNVPMGLLIEAGNTKVYSYQILKVSDTQLILCAPESSSIGDWGTSWFWAFKAK
jgi:hypothetical protein